MPPTGWWPSPACATPRGRRGGGPAWGPEEGVEVAGVIADVVARLDASRGRSR